MLPIETAAAGYGRHPLIFVVAAVTVFGILLLLRVHALRARRGLLPRRPGHTEDSFVHHVASFGLHPRIARTTYRYLQRSCKVRFPILVEDSLREDLGLDQRALIEATRALLLENGRESGQHYMPNSLVTVGDLIGFIQSSARAEIDRAA